MGRITTADAMRYDDIGGHTLCYFCGSDKVRGYDYTPHPSELIPGERGVRVRACVNCLPRLHYHSKSRGSMSIEDKKVLLQTRRVTDAPTIVRKGFATRDGLLVPSDMTCFLAPDGRPSQYFVMSENGPVDPINVADLEAAQLCIGATLLGLRTDIIEESWHKLAETVSPEVIGALQRRLL